MKFAMKPAVFLDRDGVINKWELPKDRKVREEDYYILSWEDFEVLPGAINSIRRLTGAGLRVFVVSNQSGIGKGMVEYHTIYNIFHQMDLRIARGGDGIYEKKYALSGWMFCPHHPEDGCACRKPKPGMIYYLSVQHDIDLSRSWLVGDQLTDMLAGYNAGINNLIRIQGCLHDARFGEVKIHHADDLAEAADIIRRI